MIPIKSNFGICLPGGGAAGVNQAAALKAFIDIHKENQMPKIVSSTSVGSLNAALLTQQEFDKLETLWRELDRRQVYLFNNPIKAIKSSLCTLEPLENLIKKHIDFNKLKSSRIDFVLNAAEGIGGTKVSGSGRDSDVLDGLIAGCSIPIMFSPRVYKGKWCIDGAIYENSPINPLIDAMVDKILIIHPQTKESPFKSLKEYSLLAQIRNTISLLLRTNRNKDIERIKSINILLENKYKYILPSKYRKIEIYEWYPDFYINTLDFDNIKINKAWEHSYEKAKRDFSSSSFYNFLRV